MCRRAAYITRALLGGFFFFFFFFFCVCGGGGVGALGRRTIYFHGAGEH